MEVVHAKSIANSLLDLGSLMCVIKSNLSLPERSTLVILFCFILREVKGYED